MKCFILLTIVYFANVNCREFRDYDSDPYNLGVKPYYDLKDAPQLFEKFIKDYSKTYKSEKIKMKHFEIFKKNLEEINNLNAGKEGETASYDINLFSDMESSLADDDDDNDVEEEDEEQPENNAQNNYSRSEAAYAAEGSVGAATSRSGGAYTTEGDARATAANSGGAYAAEVAAGAAAPRNGGAYAAEVGVGAATQDNRPPFWLQL